LFKVIDANKSKKPVASAVMINNMSVPICNRFYAIREYRQNNVFLGGTPIWRLSSSGTPSPRGTKFCHNKLASLGQPTVKISWS